jgi:hypothetical protein
MVGKDIRRRRRDSTPERIFKIPRETGLVEQEGFNSQRENEFFMSWLDFLLKGYDMLELGGGFTQATLNHALTSPPFTHMKVVWSTRAL